jgi:hypothetical protein
MSAEHDCDPDDLQTAPHTNLGRCQECGQWFRSSTIWEPITTERAEAVMAFEVATRG